ncbi:MAG: hypothetical protein A4E35_01449 [Methanoregula sp. PtaU1.Bin051]|nr:MAG: hypothetical protein A4E35_01449 [Methanoregula sp. PtaU1.Bin051]
MQIPKNAMRAQVRPRKYQKQQNAASVADPIFRYAMAGRRGRCRPGSGSRSALSMMDTKTAMETTATVMTALFRVGRDSGNRCEGLSCMQPVSVRVYGCFIQGMFSSQ